MGDIRSSNNHNSSKGGDEGALLKPISMEHVALPLKTTKEAEWSTQLRAYILEMGEDPSSYQSELAYFHKMRQDARGAPATSVGVEILVSYYRQLDSLSRRLPLVEHPLSLSFVWHDAFDTSTSIKQSSLAFEKANVLFNIGALYSQISKSDDMARNFQTAASVFAFIADNFLHPPLMDISRPTLLFLVSLMLAQAQEIVVGKAVVEEKSLSNLVRLAAAAATFYREACSLLAGKDLADLRSCLLNSTPGYDRDSYSLIQLKASLWEAIAEYYKGEAVYREEKVGEAIARMKHVQQILKDTNSSCQFDVQSAAVLFLKDLTKHVSLRVVLFEKENGMIYNQLAPDLSCLTAVEGVALVKTSPLADLWRAIPERQDLFKRLVPLRVHEEISKYSEEKSKLLRYETIKVATADTELQTTLTSFGFPAALDNISRNSTRHGLPEDFVCLRRKASGIQSFDKIVAQFSDRALHITQSIDKVSLALDDEIREYQNAHIEHGDSWVQPPSHTGNSELFRTMAMLNQRLGRHTAQVSQLVASISPEAKADLELITGPQEALLRLIPEESNLIDGSQPDFIQKVRSLLDDLDKLSRERTANLDGLKESILVDDISDDLAITKSQDVTSLFHQELAKFDENCKLIEDNIATHNQLLSSFKGLWREISEKKHSRQSASLREDLLRRLYLSLSVCNEVAEKIK